MTRSNKAGFPLFWLLLALSAPLLAGNTANRLYEQMRQAVHNIDYEGHFVFQVGDRLDAMYVVHRMQNGRELERLVALNGPQKQVIRGARAVACVDPRKHKISVVGTGSRLANVPVIGIEALNSLYRFEAGDDDLRVAGRPAVELLIHPLDDLRFGYRIVLDKETYLPLQSVMLENGQVRSQTLFVDLKTGHQVTPIERDLSALQLTEKPSDSPADDPIPDTMQTETAFSFGILPKGFRLIKVASPRSGVHHYLVTDGLTSVSLYVEPLDEQGFEGFSRIGATEILGVLRRGRQLTVVGEVPRKTLALIADAIQIP